MPPKRLIFDISTLARAGGQAVGIVRVSRELARYAHAHRPDVVFAINDTRIDAFRAIRPQWLGPILDTTAIVDTSALPDREQARRREGKHVPSVVRDLLFWFQHPRRRAIVALERIRLVAGGPLGRLAGRLTDRLLSPRYRRELTDAQGRRRTLVPYGMAVTAPLELGERDVLVFTGSEWGNPNFDALLREKQRGGFSLAALVHDIIPLLFPHFYAEFNVNAFRHYFEHMTAMADLIVFTSKRGQSDSEEYCAAKGIRLKACRVVPLGADPVRADLSLPPQLPDGLEAGRYALFVSTIEPRKNHAMLFAVWKRLRAEGVPQAHGFRLVFVGRAGWMVDDLLAELRAYAAGDNGLLLLSDINDRQLSDLYRGAAFLLYPSLYEGYGLPIVEGFHYGKAALASNGGALQEIAGAYSPTFDPRDEDAWYEAFRRWIEDPKARAPHEAAIREFRHPNWDEASRRFFEAIDEGLR